MGTSYLDTEQLRNLSIAFEGPSSYLYMNLPQPIIYLLLAFVYMVMSSILVLACCLCIGA